MARCGDYIVGDRLGAGGVGVVYQAHRAGSERPLVLKFLQTERRDARSIRRFRDEAMAGRLVRHPNVASVIDDGCTEDGEHYLVMERAEGESLGKLIARSRLFPLRDAVAIAREILAGIAAIHANGIIHADIKSDNVIVEPEPSRMVKLIDFGLARVQFMDDQVTTPHADEWLSGTPEYMAPEIIRGLGACFASDLYAVGIILYEMLTGTTPFAGGTPSEIVKRHLTDDVVPPSLRREYDDVPPALDQIIMRALNKDPRQRFANASAMASELASVRIRLARGSTRFARFETRCDETTPTNPGFAGVTRAKHR